MKNNTAIFQMEKKKIKRFKDNFSDLFLKDYQHNKTKSC